MTTRARSTIVFPVALAILALLTTPAEAQFGSLQRFLFRGLEYAGNPLFLSAPQNGPFFSDNLFSQRLEFNRAGGGYTYEQYRFFGNDSFNNLNTLDLGPLKFQLGGDPNLLASNQPVGVHNRVGFTTTGIPEVFFQTQTVQRFADVFAGTTDIRSTPIQYTITLNTGVQDTTITGNVLVESSGRINALGFYDLQLRTSNNGTYRTEGLLVSDERPLDFDIGPIDVSGNIGADALAALLQSVGDVSATIPQRVMSGAAQRDKDLDELLARLQAGETLTDDEMAALVQASFTAAIAQDPLGAIVNGLPSSLTHGDNVTVDFAIDPDIVAQAAPNVPEPGTFLLMASVFGAVAWPRLGRRRTSA